MNTYFICKIQYLRQADNGSIFKKKDNYLLNALSFIEAETRLQTVLEEYIPEYNLLACAKTNVTDVIIDQSKEFFFKVKLQYISTNEDSGKETKITENYIVQASTVEDAHDIMQERLKGSVVQCEIKTVSQTNIVDVFPYVEETIVTKITVSDEV